MDFTGERYVPGIGGSIALEHEHRYRFCLDIVKERRVLDIACGEGFGSAMMAEQATEVFGVDIDAAAITHADQTYKRENLHFLQGTCTAIPLVDGSVDVVVSFETIEHLAEHDKMLMEVRRVLRPGGLLLISSPNKEIYSDRSGYKNPFHVRELYTHEFITLVKCHFTNTRHFRQRTAAASIIASAGAKAPMVRSTDSGSANFMKEARYDVILASDKPLPTLPGSLYKIPDSPLNPEQAELSLASKDREIFELREESNRLSTRLQLLADDANRIVELRDESDQLRTALQLLADDANKIVNDQWWKVASVRRLMSDLITKLLGGPEKVWPTRFEPDYYLSLSRWGPASSDSTSTNPSEELRTARNLPLKQYRNLVMNYIVKQLSKAKPPLSSWMTGRFALSVAKRDQNRSGTEQSRARLIPSLGTRCNPHITVVSMARNEAGRAEETMRHFCALFDRVVIIDHLSEDHTASIVARYNGHEGTEVVLLRGEDKGYYQSEYMTAVARRLISEGQSDWVFFIDFDEYLPFRDLQSFRQALVALADADVIHSHWINVMRNDSSQGRFAGSMVQLGPTVSRYVKIALNLSQLTSDNIVIAQGNHSVYLNGSKQPYIGRRAFGLYHMPFSEESAFRQKIAQGVGAYEATLGHDDIEGSHWKKMAEKIDILIADSELTKEVALRYGEPLSHVIEDVKTGRTTKDKRPFLLDFAQTNLVQEIGVVPQDIPSFTLKTINRVLSERFPILGGKTSAALVGSLAKAVYESLPEVKAQLEPRETETRVQRAILAGSTELELIVPTVWFGHIPFLFSLMEAMRPRRYVELGTHAGGSFFAACQHIKANYHYGEAVAVDLWQGDSHTGYYDEYVFANFKHLLGEHFPNAGRFIRGHFDDAVSAFEPGSIDLLHIDGLHTYEAVRNDYETWRSRLTPNGTIIFHDTNEYQTDFGVWQLFEEIRNSAFASFQFRHSHGLGIMAFGDPRTNPAIELIEYFRANAELVESYYATLGKALFQSAQYSLNNVK
jgi:SAM-dependent methyltransferase